MSFHLGKPILVMLVAAAVSGTAILLRPGTQVEGLRVWVFADMHYRCYQTLVGPYQKHTGQKVQLSLVQARAMNIRLESCFMSGSGSEEMPELVEVEISNVGRFFRPPLKDVGFLDLTERLKKSGWYDRIVQSRFAPWSKAGHIFGVPHDVHPVTITYRDDLFRQAGIDLSAAKTWPAFHEACLKFQDYWNRRGYTQRHAIELPAATAENVIIMLLQRHINLVDDFNRIYLADLRVANTLAFYAQLVAGERNIASESTGGTGAFTKDLNEGNICAFITPDWRLSSLRQYASPELRGRMRMMPLPVFEPGDVPTATWGGTMMAIPRTCKDPDKAWKLLEYLYFSRDGIEARRKTTDILPPIRSYWDDAYYHRSDEFFGGQKVGEMLTGLAGQIPPRYVTPATAIAGANLTYVLNLATAHVRSRGTEGLETQCRQWLKLAADDLKKRMDHWSFDEPGESR